VSDPSCWGIFREQTHSPGRETDDAEILRLTAKHLEAAGFPVDIKTAEEVGSLTEARPRCVFLMCEDVQVLRQLETWQAEGVREVNDPMAVLNTYRDRMIGQFAEANVPFIESHIVSTTGHPSRRTLPVWVKRADVHNTQGGDVVFADTEDAVESALGGLAERGIARAVLQPHIEGDLIKFYGIGPGGGPDGEPPWFRWFYHKGQRVAGHAFDPRRLARLVRRAAAALGLEIYGGDVIVTATGDIVLLDLNAWPSFALYRDEAAVAIAAYLTQRFRGGR
jgi:glutathione synthase/RimK-type ligase-like ATP-grasp enzyme